MVSRIFIFALLFTGLAVPAHALRFYVNQTTGDDRRSHMVVQDSDTPWRTITHALEMAHILTQGRPHVIDIAAGSYSPSSGETLPFVISQTNIYLRSQGGVELNAQGLSRIIEVAVPSPDFMLRDFSPVNGTADRGGAVSCESCSLRVVHSRILGNQATLGGDAIYVADGRLQLMNNIIRINGSSGSGGAIIEARNTFADTSQRDVIRNNTFYLNDAPSILTTGNRTDISNNILVGTPGDAVPAIIDSASGIEPLVRYNLFWDTDILYLSGARDSVKVARTVRDTLTLEEQGVAVPSFVTNVPDTVAQVGTPYEFDVAFESDDSNYKFTVINSSDIPVGMSEETIETSGILSWTPDSTQTGQHSVRVEIIDQGAGQFEFLSYIITVFTAEDFPDTTTPGDIITVTTTPDTTAATDSLNLILPVFSTAASAGGNVYGDPLFLDPEIKRFELQTSKTRIIIPTGDTVGVLDTVNTVAMDAGNPVTTFNDAVLSGGQVRNDMGQTGGPTNSGPPTPGSSSELVATVLPDSIAIEGQTWIYDPAVQDTSGKAQGDPIIIDLLQGPSTMSDVFGSGDDKLIPVEWIPALADTGSYLVGLSSFYTGGSARHYFPLRVRAANPPPRVTSTPPTTAPEDVELVYTIEAVDDNGDTISYSLDSGPGGMTVDSLGVVRWTPSQSDVDSTFTVTIGLTDTGGASNTHTFTFVVDNTNDAPVAAAVSDTTATEDVLFQLALTAVDEDPADTTFTFSLTTAPDSVAIDSLNRLVWTPVQSDVGVHALTVRVTDAGGAVDSTSFALTVIEVDDVPTISSSPDTTAPEDALYEYAVEAVDEEAGTLSYSLVTAPTGMTVDSLGVVSWTPALADTGAHTVALAVADPAGQTVEQSYQLQVLEVNDPPVILVRSPVDTLVLIDPGQSVQFDLDSEDEEGDPLTLQWLVDGVQKSTASSFTHLADTTSADTVVANLTDGTSTTSTTWIVDARAIAKVSVATDTVDFGDVALGDTASATLRVLNPGRTTLTITNLQVGDLAFAASFGTDAITLRDSTTLTLSFAATTRGARTTEVQFGTNDPDIPTVTIPLAGAAVVPTRAALDADLAAGDQGIRTGTGRLGDTVVLDVEVSETLEILSYAVELTFDPEVFSFESVAADADVTNLLGAGLLPVATEPASGTLRIEVAGNDTVSGDGFFGRVTFNVASDAETGVSSAIGLARVELLSSGQATSDVLTSSEGVTLQIATALPGDVDGGGTIDIDDFFLFADDFGGSAARSDFNSDGTVDFTDFFLFVDFFNGAAARPLPDVEASMPGLALAVDDRPTSADRLDAVVHWRAEESLRGAGLWLIWDPRHLSFDEVSATDPESNRTLLWTHGEQPGRLELAAVPVGGGAFDGDVATLQFRRLTPQATEIRLEAAVGRDASGVTRGLDLPTAATVAALPRVAVLYPPHPNPFNPETVISFFVPSRADTRVEVTVYDLLGRPVRTLSSGGVEGGHHRLVWRGRDDAGRQAGAGVYLVEMRTNERRLVRKVMLLK